MDTVGTPIETYIMECWKPLDSIYPYYLFFDNEKNLIYSGIIYC